MAENPVEIGAITEALTNKTDTDVQNTTTIGSAQIAHFAMPSDSYETLTVSSSGTEWTATADGYVCFQGKAINASAAFVEVTLAPDFHFRVNSFV